MDFNTAYEKLECPHTDSCLQEKPRYSIITSRKENTLVLDVECNDCHGADHLRFDTASLHKPNQLKDINVGDKFVFNSTDILTLDSGDRCVITAIADNPLYSGKNPIVGVVTETDNLPSHSGHIYDVDRFQHLLDKEAIQLLNTP